MRQTHGTQGTQGIIFADDLYLTFLGKTSKFGRSSMVKGWFGGKWLPLYTDSVLLCAVVTGALCRKTDPKIATAPKTQSRSKDQNKDKDNSK